MIKKTTLFLAAMASLFAFSCRTGESVHMEDDLEVSGISFTIPKGTPAGSHTFVVDGLTLDPVGKLETQGFTRIRGEVDLIRFEQASIKRSIVRTNNYIDDFKFERMDVSLRPSDQNSNSRLIGTADLNSFDRNYLQTHEGLDLKEMMIDNIEFSMVFVIRLNDALKNDYVYEMEGTLRSRANWDEPSNFIW